MQVQHMSATQAKSSEQLLKGDVQMTQCDWLHSHEQAHVAAAHLLRLITAPSCRG